MATRLLVTAHRKGRIRQVIAAHPGSLSGPVFFGPFFNGLV
jgi:hypothetical protein